MAETYQDTDKKSNVAKTLATIALVLALLALFWAIKADKQANEALEAVQPVTQQEVPSNTDTTDDFESGVNSNGNGNDPGTNGIPPEAETVDP